MISILEYNLDKLGDVLAAAIAIAMWFCGLASVGAAGRMLFAFSRDDGIPGSRWLKQVSHRYRTPANALTAVVVVSWLFTVATFIVGTGTAIVIVTAISTIFLYAAYGLVIFLGVRTDEWKEHRVWSLGRWSRPVAWVAVFWVVVLMVLFSLPDVRQHLVAVHARDRHPAARVLLRVGAKPVQGPAGAGRPSRL